MNRSGRRLAILALAIAPITLGLAACKKGEGDAPASGERIAPIAAPQGKTWSDTVAKTPEGGVVMGNPAAPIKLIEYGSLTCPHCGEFAKLSEPELREKFVDSGRVSFEFRNFVRDGIDLTAATLVHCAPPEAFFALTQQTFANQAEMFKKAQGAGEAAYTAAMNQPDAKRGIALAQLTGLTDFFAARGLPVAQANACLADTTAAKALADRTEKQGAEFDIQGTPTFLINGAKVPASSWDELKARLEAMGAR